MSPCSLARTYGPCCTSMALGFKDGIKMYHGYSMWQAWSGPRTEEIQPRTRYPGYLVGPPNLWELRDQKRKKTWRERSMGAGGAHGHEPCKDRIPCSRSGLELGSVWTWPLHDNDESCSSSNGELRIDRPGSNVTGSFGTGLGYGTWYIDSDQLWKVSWLK